MVKKKNSDVKFDDLMQQIDVLVRNLESDEINLDDAVETYKEAVKLIKLSQEKLGEAEAQVKELVRDSENKLSTQNLD